MKKAVLLMAHGSPDSLDEMEAYLRHVMTRRPPTPPFVADMTERYRLIGGRSPLLDITRAQAEALAKKLDMPVYVGMRHGTPFIHEAVERARRDGIERLVGLPLAPHYSKVSVGADHAALEAAAGDMKIACVRSWATEPSLLKLWASRLSPGATVLFTAHSVPVDGAGSYPEEIQATMRGILELVKVDAHFAYQSRSPSPIPWLGPEVPEVLDKLRGREILVAPIGFVSDHVEVLYDLDILHRGQAERLEVGWTRVPMPNADPLLIDALAATVRAALPSQQE